MFCFPTASLAFVQVFGKGYCSVRSKSRSRKSKEESMGRFASVRVAAARDRRNIPAMERKREAAAVKETLYTGEAAAATHFPSRQSYRL